MGSPQPVARLLPRFVLLSFLFLLFYVMGSLFVAIPETAGSGLTGPETPVSEPGLVSPTSGLLIITLVNLLIIIPVIQTSRWGGWKLALLLALSYYGAATFVVQLESWYFLTFATSTVDAQTLPGRSLVESITGRRLPKLTAEHCVDFRKSLDAQRLCAPDPPDRDHHLKFCLGPLHGLALAPETSFLR